MWVSVWCVEFVSHCIKQCMCMRVCVCACASKILKNAIVAFTPNATYPYPPVTPADMLEHGQGIGVFTMAMYLIQVGNVSGSI